MNISPTAYITGRQLILFILLYSKVIRLVCFQFFKDQIYRIFEALIILSRLRRIDHIYERYEVLFLFHAFIKYVSNVCLIQQLLSL